MKKTTIVLIVSTILLIIVSIMGFLEIISKELSTKMTLFITATIAFILAYLTGIKKEKHGLTNGIIVGISIAIISLAIHFISKTIYFDLFFVRGLVFIISGAMGGIIGVNKNMGH